MQELTVAQRIRFLRDQAGLTQEKLARNAGLTKEYISKIERDQANNVGFQTYEAIAKALGVNVRLVLFGDTHIYAPNTIQGMEKAPEIKVPGQDLLPISKDEEEFLLAFRSITDKGKKRILRELAQSFDER